MRDWIDQGVDEHDEASLPTPHPHDYMSADEIRDEERRHDEAREELIRDMVAESQAAEPAAWELLVIAHDVLADLWDPRQARGGLAARHQRTRKAQKLMETTCSRVENFCMDEHGRIILGLREPIEDARILGPEEAEAFARADGLGVDGSTAYDDLHGFLLVNYGLPFEGVVIYW